MRQGGREKEIGSTRVATRSSCFYFILFYFIFIFLLGKQKKVKPAQCKLFLDGETEKRPSSYLLWPTALSVCVDTVCVSVCVWGVCGVCHKVLGNLDGRDVLVAPALLTTCRQCQRSQEWSGEGRKRSSFFVVDKEQSRRRLERLEGPPVVYLFILREMKRYHHHHRSCVCACVCVLAPFDRREIF